MKIVIGIPVYNGEMLITQTLDSISQSIDDSLKKNFIVLISDNCSTDNTTDIAAEFAANADYKIIIHKNDRNLGYDGNIDQLIRIANGDYLWLLGCGEMIKPAALPILYNKIKNTGAKQYIINFEVFSEHFRALISENNYRKNSDTFFNDENAFSFITEYNAVEYCLSGNIFSLSLAQRILDKPLEEEGWAHVERIWQSCLNNGISAYFISDICFTLYQETGGWYEKPVVVDNVVAIAKLSRSYLRSKYPQAAQVKIHKNVDSFLRHGIFVCKKAGKLIPVTTVITMISLFYKVPKFWIQIIPILLIPSFAIRFREILKRA